MADFFSLFSLPPAFELDEAALERAYFGLQRQFHPDRFAAKPAAERQAAMQKSVAINDAYHTLRDPRRRAQYLLQLQGIRVGTERDSVKPVPEVLAEAMAWREEMEEGGDAEALAQRLAGARAGCLRELAAELAAGEWAKAAQSTLRLTYLEKALEEVEKMGFKKE